MPTAEDAEGVTRRTIVKGAAWSIPVIATATAASFASASVAFTLTATLTSALTACGTAPLELLLKDAQGTPASGPVTVALPAGLTWDDGTTADKVVTTDANGRATLTVKGTGQGGTFTITGQGLTPTPTSHAQAVATVAATGGRIFYRAATSGIAVAAVNADPTGSVPDPVQVYATGYGGQLQVLTADGSWYRSSGASTNSALTWAKVDAPAMQMLAPGLYPDPSWGLTLGGDVYQVSGGTPATRMSSPVTFTRLMTGGTSSVFGITSDGVLYTATSSSSFTPVMTTSGSQLPPVTFVHPEDGDDVGGLIVFADDKVYVQRGGTPAVF